LGLQSGNLFFCPFCPLPFLLGSLLCLLCPLPFLVS
jgi:hypothetical protein